MTNKFKGIFNDPAFYVSLATSLGVSPPFAIDEQNSTIHSDIVGTITTDGSSPKKNNRVFVEVSVEN